MRDGNQSRLPIALRLSAVIALSWLAAGCASAPPASDKDAVAAYAEANDPIEPLNRYIFELNIGADKLLIRPLAEIYRGALPQGAQDSVRNMTGNLNTPLTFLHDLLQGETERAGQSFGRFTGNTFLGVGGLFDVMAGEEGKDIEAGIPHHSEDLGQTLAVWGASEGPFIMLPILGPSNLRDSIGIVGDSFLDPARFLVDEKNRVGFTVLRRGLRGIDQRARNIETLDDIERNSIDYYATVRSLYRQYRTAQIANGRTPDYPLPEMSGDFEDDIEEERVSSAVE